MGTETVTRKWSPGLIIASKRPNSGTSWSGKSKSIHCHLPQRHPHDSLAWFVFVSIVHGYTLTTETALSAYLIELWAHLPPRLVEIAKAPVEVPLLLLVYLGIFVQHFCHGGKISCEGHVSNKITPPSWLLGTERKRLWLRELALHVFHVSFCFQWPEKNPKIVL